MASETRQTPFSGSFKQKNPFEIMELPANFVIDADVLEQRYLNFQREWHPDRFLRDAPLAQKVAEQRFADLTTAYQILSCPLWRIEALLRLNGCWPIPQDPACLERMMALRELKEDDPHRAEQELILLKAQILKEIEGHCATKSWEACAQAYNTLSYTMRLLEEC